MAPEDNAIEIDLARLQTPNSILLIDDEANYRDIIRTILLARIPTAQIIETNCHNQLLTAIGALIAEPSLTRNILGAVLDKDGYSFRRFSPDIVMPVSELDSGITLAHIMLNLGALKPPVILQSAYIERAVNGSGEDFEDAIKKPDLETKLPAAIERLFLPRLIAQ